MPWWYCGKPMTVAQKKLVLGELKGTIICEDWSKYKMPDHKTVLLAYTWLSIQENAMAEFLMSYIYNREADAAGNAAGGVPLEMLRAIKIPEDVE